MSKPSSSSILVASPKETLMKFVHEIRAYKILITKKKWEGGTAPAASFSGDFKALRRTPLASFSHFSRHPTSCQLPPLTKPDQPGPAPSTTSQTVSCGGLAPPQERAPTSTVVSPTRVRSDQWRQGRCYGFTALHIKVLMAGSKLEQLVMKRNGKSNLDRHKLVVKQEALQQKTVEHTYRSKSLPKPFSFSVDMLNITIWIQQIEGIHWINPRKYFWRMTAFITSILPWESLRVLKGQEVYQVSAPDELASRRRGVGRRSSVEVVARGRRGWVGAHRRRSSPEMDVAGGDDYLKTHEIDAFLRKSLMSLLPC
ncbi:hypothetical protein E3N88_31757 [Mikania micrantha]|uniref:Uncharacterized protein n=1 Tax=Mikania micrantha TaxID=192012 RepID=A0A5N6M969_9ASTR|nr:hypothetical protein E3N88_31757 [Mikania micrantha]